MVTTALVWFVNSREAEMHASVDGVRAALCSRSVPSGDVKFTADPRYFNALDTHAICAQCDDLADQYYGDI